MVGFILSFPRNEVFAEIYRCCRSNGIGYTSIWWREIRRIRIRKWVEGEHDVERSEWKNIHPSESGLEDTEKLNQWEDLLAHLGLVVKRETNLLSYSLCSRMMLRQSGDRSKPMRAYFVSISTQHKSQWEITNLHFSFSIPPPFLPTPPPDLKKICKQIDHPRDGHCESPL